MQMNNYPIWWDTTVTVYNRYEDSQTHLIRWYRTVIENCFYKDVGNTININNIEVNTNNIVCRIRKDSRYRKPSQWVQIPNDQKENYFTLKPEDIIVVGEITEEIDESVDGHRSTDFIKKYKAFGECLTIQEAGDNTGTGRSPEHYRVNGI